MHTRKLKLQNIPQVGFITNVISLLARKLIYADIELRIITLYFVSAEKYKRWK